MKFFITFAATLACALAYAPIPAYYNSYAHGTYGYAGAYAGAYAYPPAQVTVLSNGHIADTPEVAHAKAAHYVAKAEQAAVAAAHPDFDSHTYNKDAYVHAPVAYAAPVYSSGYVAPYTSAYAAPYASGYVAPYSAAHVAPYSSGYVAPYSAAHVASYSSAYATPYSAAHAVPYSSGYAPAYAGAYAYGPAHITVLPNGYLADTPEVSQAKVAHSVAKAHVAAAAAASPDYTSPPHSGYGYVAHDAHYSHY